MLKGLVDGLEQFHRRNLSHGDVHTQNLRVTLDGNLKIFDPIEAEATLASRTTALNRERRRLDISCARALITQALYPISGNTDAIGHFNMLQSAQDNLAELRLRLDAVLRACVGHGQKVAISTHQGLQLNPASSQHNYYHDQFKSARQLIPSQLDSWYADGPQVPATKDGVRLGVSIASLELTHFYR